MRIENDAEGVACSPAARAQVRVVAQDRAHADQNGLVFPAQTSAVGARGFVGYPFRISGRGCHLAVKARGKFERDERPLLLMQREELFIQRPCFFLQEPGRNAYSRFPEHRQPASVHFFVRVERAKNDFFNLGGDDSGSARRSSPLE